MRCSGLLGHLRLNLFLIFLLFNLSYGGTAIELKKYVETNRSDLTLSQIAEIKVVQNLKSGEKKVLTKKEIRQILKENYVKQMIFAPVVKKDMIRGQIINEDDIEIKKIPLQRGIVTDRNILIGAVVRTTIKKGNPVKISMINPDYPVKRRSYVKVIYDRNGIKIEITGVALENGIKGQVIKVKNLSTGKILPCRVIGKDTVLFVGGL